MQPFCMIARLPSCSCIAHVAMHGVALGSHGFAACVHPETTRDVQSRPVQHSARGSAVPRGLGHGIHRSTEGRGYNCHISAVPTVRGPRRCPVCVVVPTWAAFGYGRAWHFSGPLAPPWPHHPSAFPVLCVQKTLAEYKLSLLVAQQPARSRFASDEVALASPSLAQDAYVSRFDSVAAKRKLPSVSYLHAVSWMLIAFKRAALSLCRKTWEATEKVFEERYHQDLLASCSPVDLSDDSDESDELARERSLEKLDAPMSVASTSYTSMSTLQLPFSVAASLPASHQHPKHHQTAHHQQSFASAGSLGSPRSLHSRGGGGVPSSVVLFSASSMVPHGSKIAHSWSSTSYHMEESKLRSGRTSPVRWCVSCSRRNSVSYLRLAAVTCRMCPSMWAPCLLAASFQGSQGRSTKGQSLRPRLCPPWRRCSPEAFIPRPSSLW